MVFIRRSFYFILGLSLPIFWVFHANGLGSILYRPLQWLFKTETTVWPSLATTVLLYLTISLVFEFFYRLLIKYHP